MGRRRRALGVAAGVASLAIVAAAAVLATHDEPSSGDAAVTTTTEPAPAEPQPGEPQPVQPEIELLEPGAAPRRAVRLTLEAGDRATVRHTTDVDVEVRASDRTQRFDPPAASHVVAYEVRRIDGPVALVDAVIEAVYADDAVLRDALAPLVGTRTSFEVDARGRAASVDFEVPAAASDALRSQLHQLEDQIAQFGPLLPEAPIGAGARWRVTTDTTATTFTVTELDDEVLRYTTEVTVTDGSSQLAGTGSGTMALRTIAPQWTTELDGSIDPGQDLTIRSAAEPSEPR